MEVRCLFEFGAPDAVWRPPAAFARLEKRGLQGLWCLGIPRQFFLISKRAETTGIAQRGDR
jgi:hypothetical protein